ncbi:inverse autotransporter beta domain-containing protein, partial [Salmonella enterica subsp. enterica serovar Cerro]|nr:inverse autotransporter beta domain-containing protein [Salmonella enterica subsp. enterica serovar Cerro]
MPFLLSFVVEVADTLSRIVFRSFSLSLLLLTASGTICAQAQDPFTQNRLPDLGMMPESHEGEKHFAEMAKAFGEASMKNNDLDTGEQARQFAFGQVRDVVSEQVNQQLESWLSAWGSASVDINVDNEGHFNGSRAPASRAPLLIPSSVNCRVWRKIFLLILAASLTLNSYGFSLNP